MMSNFSEEAQNVLNGAREEMVGLRHPYIGTEHLILSILRVDNEIRERLLEYNLSYEGYRKVVMEMVPAGSLEADNFIYTPLLRRVIESSCYLARESGLAEISVRNLFASMLEIGEGTGIRCLVNMGVNIGNLYTEFHSLSRGKSKKKLMVMEFGVCLNDMARDGKLDPVIGRDREVTRVMEILCRRSKNNPVLVGEAGVGKSAIVEEVARRIEFEMVPDRLLGKRIISISMANLVAGTKYRGEFEDRMRKLIREVEDEDDIILFIDEVHTLVGAGGAEGAIDASNILKPALARGKFVCIGATTVGEYKKSIRVDSALDRRFQVVNVKEPSKVETRGIIGGLRDIYEIYHNVVLSDGVLDDIVEYADRYIVGRYFPDKAIDVMDEVCAMVSTRGDEKRRVITELRGRINLVRRDKNCSILGNRLEEAYEMLREEKRLLEEVDALTLAGKRGRNVVSRGDVVDVVARISGVRIYGDISNSDSDMNREMDMDINNKEMDISNKVSDMNKEMDMNRGSESMQGIMREIGKSFVGSDRVKRALSGIVWRRFYGFGKRRGVYLFAGPSGVGKTMAGKILGRMLGSGDGDNVIRVDMSEFSDSSSVSKVIGSNPGYVGYEDTGSVVERIRNMPSGVILLDEVDKAHSSVMGLFYQIMDEGFIRDNRGELVRINNLIVMTTNVGYEKEKVGFGGDEGRVAERDSELRRVFGDAFMNRIDGVVYFDRLERGDVVEIVKREIDVVGRECRWLEKYREWFMDEEFVSGIVRDSDFSEYGARKVKRLVSERMESVIEEIMASGLGRNDEKRGEESEEERGENSDEMESMSEDGKGGKDVKREVASN